MENSTNHASVQVSSGISRPPLERASRRQKWADAHDADDNGNAEYLRALYPDRFLYSSAFGWMEYAGTHWRRNADAAVTGAAIRALKKRNHEARDALSQRAARAIVAWREIPSAARAPHDDDDGFDGDGGSTTDPAEEQGMEALRRSLAATTNPRTRAAQVVRATQANEARVRGCVTLFRSYVTEPDASAFDREPDLLNCKNGVLNLQTGELVPHHPRQRFTYCLDTAYDPAADTSEVERFVDEATGGDGDLARFLQVAAGYSLTGHTREEKLFYLFGPTRAGKDTFVGSLMALLPHPLGMEVDFASFTARREADSQNFDLAALRPARLVIASESNRQQSLNPAKIKQLTGGNRVRAAFKYHDLFEYLPQFKVWLVSNHEVNGDPDDDALWGRVLVMHFPRSHLGGEDTRLKERLRSPENLRAWLRWAQEGAATWYREGLHPPRGVLIATRAQRDGQDSVKLWIDDCCELGAGRWAASGALQASYRAWCEGNDMRPSSMNQLADALTKRFGCTPKIVGTRLEKRRGFSGIQRNTDVSPGERPAGGAGDRGDGGSAELGDEQSEGSKIDLAASAIPGAPADHGSAGEDRTKSEEAP